MYFCFYKIPADIAGMLFKTYTQVLSGLKQGSPFFFNL